MTVNKTVSFPLPVINKIAELQEYTQQDFSTTLVRILRIGMRVYEDQVVNSSEADNNA